MGYAKTSRLPVCHREEREAIRRDFDCALVSLIGARVFSKTACVSHEVPWESQKSFPILASMLVLQEKCKDEE